MMKEVLVKGYTAIKEYPVGVNAVIIEGVTYHELWEHLYAVYPDGHVEKCVKLFSNTFNEKGVEWIRVSELPDDVEFIGNYYMPKGGRA